jgi:undecaprenyl-diphosphatase
MLGLDEATLRAAYGTPAWAVPIFFVFTVIGGGWGLIALVPFALRRSTRLATLWLFAGLAVTSGVVSLLKALVGRVRPCDALPWCAPLSIQSPGGPSFPSGHAAGSFAFAVFVTHHAPRLWPLLLLYAAVVSFSRCVLGVHYPSDVLFGALLGAALGAVFARAAMKRNAHTRDAKAGADE